MKRYLIFTLMILATLPTWAASAKITTNSSDCSTAASCLSVNLGRDNGGAALTISGTWTGTISFEASGDGGANWVAINVMPVANTTAVTSTTSGGVWQVNVAGLGAIRMRASATVTGTAIVTITPSAASFAR